MKKKGYRIGMRLLSLLLSMAMFFTVHEQPLLAATTDSKNELRDNMLSLRNPKVEKEQSMNSGQKVTYDCIWFGDFPQSEVTKSSKSEYNTLESAVGWNEDNTIIINGVKYCRMTKSDALYFHDGHPNYYKWDDETTYHYFKYEPIKWRVLSVNNGKALLLSDKSIGNQEYNFGNTTEPWDKSTMRSWLNGYGRDQNSGNIDYSDDNFVKTAFSSQEEYAISGTFDNMFDSPIFLLSGQDLINVNYGFSNNPSLYDEARLCIPSDYAKALGVCSVVTNASYIPLKGGCWWWLRWSDLSTDTCEVNYLGETTHNYDEYDKNIGVRPSLYLDLSFYNLYSYAGTVCTDGTVNEKGNTSKISSFAINSTIYGFTNKDIIVSGTLTLSDNAETSSDILSSEVSAIKWTSSDQSIVPDSEISCTGVNSYDNRSAELMVSFTPHKEGKVTITGTASNGLTASCEVTIGKTAIPIDFKLTDNYLEGQIDKEYQIAGSLFLDTNGITSEQIIKDELNGIIWESSDDSIASISKKSYELVEDNYSASFILDIKAKKKGTVQITGKTLNGLSVSCKIKAIDAWKFTNSSSYFGNQGYYITGTDYQRLISNLSNVNRDNVTNKHQSKTLYNVDNKGKAYTPWGGSCYGMSAWTCLVNSDLLKPSDVKKSSRTINEIEIDNGVKSAINYYMWQQVLSVSQQEVKEFMTLSQKSQLEHLEVLAKQCEQGGNPIFIRFQWYDKFKSDNSCDKRSSHGHVVVGYGFEEGEWSSSMWGNISINDVFNKRILIYDCACPNNERYDLYYNDAGTWCIPGWGIVSTTSQSRDSKFNNGQLKLATSEFADINLVDYVTGTVSPVVADNYGENILTALSDVDYSVNTIEGSADIVGFSVSNSTFNDPIVVSVDDSVTPDATLTTGNSSAFLPQSSYYEVKTDNSSMYFQLESQNHIATVGTNDSGTIKFGLNGSVNVQTDNMATTYVRLTTNDVEGKVFSYPTVEIQNDNTSETSLDIVEEGVIIKSNNLNGVVISAQNYDNEDTVNLTVDSDKDRLLVSESDGFISVLEDSNNDGTYDAVIGTGRPDSKASYTITYDLNGGSVSGNPTSYTADILPITLKNPTRNGYTFTGWTGSNGNTLQKTVMISKGSTGNKSYTANWSKNQSAKTNIKGVQISLKKTSYVYDGKKKQPSVIVKVGSKKLKKGTDYKVTYKNNQKVGIASVIISGTGKYTGKVTKKFKIIPKGTSVSKVIAKSKGFAVSWRKQAKSTDGYQLQYSTSKKFTKKATVTKTVKKSSKTKLDVKKCKAKKRYYVRVRTYKTVKGKKYYSGWSKVKMITTKK